MSWELKGAAWSWLAIGLICSISSCVPVVTTASYDRLSQDLLARGYLRTEVAPADAPYGFERLTETFRELTFSYEFHFDGDRIVNERIGKPLKRWSGTIRYKLIGDGFTVADTEETNALFERLAKITDLQFTLGEEAPDLLISIAGPQGRSEVSEHLAEQGLPVYRQRYDLWRQTPDWMCGATLSSSGTDPGRLVFAHVFIRSEVTGLLRTACLQEEIIQSLGLTNDSDNARPSLFNDDLEFAVMTEHDELLLRALYDPRLQTGMTESQAIPIIRQIFTESLPPAD